MSVRALTQEADFEISRRMQYAIMNQIARRSKWGVGDAAFHGGTSIQTVHGSDRWSEDVDFMVSQNQQDTLIKMRDSVLKGVQTELSAFYPDCKITMKIKGRDAELVSAGDGGVEEQADDWQERWTVKWEHPDVRGKVMVKAEFYMADPQALAQYQTSLRKPEFKLGNKAFRVAAMMPVAELISLWADKCKVIALRDYTKYRDAYDLAFISSSMERNGSRPSDAELRRAVQVTAGIYGNDLNDIIAGLKTRLTDTYFTDLDAFAQDLTKWLTKDDALDYAAKNVFKPMLERARGEVEQCLAILTEAAPSPVKRQTQQSVLS